MNEDNNTTCTEEAETVTVTSVPSTLSSEQTWVPNDAVTVTAEAGSGDLDGTVSFVLYDTATCEPSEEGGDPLYSTTQDVSGDPVTGVEVSTSNTDEVDASGSFSWRIKYDSNNPAQQSIGWSCEETSVLTIDNGDPVSSSTS